MGGTTAVLSEAATADEPSPRRGWQWRVVLGGAVLVALGVYAALVDELPDLTRWWDVALAGLLLIPALLAVAWLALPLHTWERLPLAALLLVAVALACAAAGLDVVGNLAKALAVILLALVFLGFFERPWWIGLVALAIPLVDALSVWRGPTRHIVTERPAVFDVLSVAFPVPGGSFQLGLPDVLFFALFLGAAARWRMRVGLSWLLMTASFGVTMWLALWLDPFGLGGLPALPLLSLAFLLANGDHLVRELRRPPAPVRYLRPLPDPEPEPEPDRTLTVGIAVDEQGWVAAGLENGRLEWTVRRPTLAEALALAGPHDRVAVDAPDTESRLDAIADRLYLGPPARRVYREFLRELLEARDDAEAEALCSILGWAGMTGESLAFRRRAFELREHEDDPRLSVVEAAGRTPAERARAAAEQGGRA